MLIAACNGNFDLVKFLVSHHADVSIKTEVTSTSLFLFLALFFTFYHFLLIYFVFFLFLETRVAVVYGNKRTTQRDCGLPLHPSRV